MMQKARDYKYDVFISYARKDYLDQENNVIPTSPVARIKELFDKSGLRYWLDVGEIIASDLYAQKITEAIIDSEYFLYISSELSNMSPWTSKEIALANHYHKKIVPCRIDGSFYNPSVAFFLADIDYIDYAINPDKAMERIEKSIVDPIRINGVQNGLIEAIKLDIEDLGIREREVNAKRKRLLLDIAKVERSDERAHLKGMLEETFLAKKYNELDLLRNELKGKDDRIREQECRIAEMEAKLEATVACYEEELVHMKQAIKKEVKKPIKEAVIAPAGEKKNSRLAEIFKSQTSHPVVTRVLLVVSIIALFLCSLNALFFASDDVIWKYASSGLLPYAELEFIVSVLAAYMLFQLLQRNRLNVMLYYIPLGALLIMGAYESVIQGETLVMWPIQIQLSASSLFIPYGLMLAVIYIMGFASCFIKSKGDDMNSWSQMKVEPVWQYLNPTRHLGLYLIIPLIITIIWVVTI